MTCGIFLVVPQKEDQKTKNKTIITALILTILPLLLITTQTASATTWDIQLTNTTGSTTIILTYANLTAMPQTTVYADLKCYGAPVTSGDWTGVQLSQIINLLGSDQSVGSVDFKAQDGYKTSLPISDALRSDVIVAYQKDGSLLGETYRLVVPQANGNVWISMITSISLSTTPLTSGVSSNSMPPAEPGWLTQQIDQSRQPTPTPTQQPSTPAPSPSTAPMNSTQPISQPADVTPTPTSLPTDSASQSYPYATIVAVVLVGVFAVVSGFVLYRRRRSTA